MRKKFLYFVLIVCLFVMGVSPIMAANIASCEGAIGDAIIDEKVPNLVSTAILVIKIVVPVLLVIFGMMDLMKGITAGKEDEIKKGQQLFIKRLIAGALVFFVFTIVQLLISFVADDEDKDNITNCANCFLNGDCTYQFKDKVKKVCPDGYSPNKEKTHCNKDEK